MSESSDTRFVELLARLRENGFRDLAGSQLRAHIPVSSDLINALVATGLPVHAPVRAVTIRPEANDRFSVRIQPKAALIPTFTVQLAIEDQPRLPQTPVVTLRMVTLGGLFGLASGAIAGMLPPGVRLDGERIHLDLRGIAEQRGAGEAFDCLTRLEIHTEQGRVVATIDAAIGRG